MNMVLLSKIRHFLTTEDVELAFPTASDEVLAQAEAELGFPIPELLKGCLTKLGNGGFGPGYGLIGLVGGYQSDYGDLVETYRTLSRSKRLEGGEWPKVLLPFCEWGCNIFSCVDCGDVNNPVYTMEELAFREGTCSLDDFFELWMSDADILDNATDIEDANIVNPFNGLNDSISKQGDQRP